MPTPGKRFTRLAGASCKLVGACFTFAGACFTFAGACFTFAGACFTFAGACFTFAGACFTFAGVCFTFAGACFTFAGASFTFAGACFTFVGRVVNLGGDTARKSVYFAVTGHKAVAAGGYRVGRVYWHTDAMPGHCSFAAGDPSITTEKKVIICPLTGVSDTLVFEERFLF